MASKRVAVIGASGYGGLQTLRLLQGHPELEVTFLGGERSSGKRWSELTPFLPLPGDPVVQSPDPDTIADSADLAVLSLPNGLASRLVPQLLERVRKPDAAVGIMLDGFPRTVPQAEALGTMLASKGKALNAVIQLDVARALLEERLGNDELAYQQYLPCLEQLHLLDDLNGIAWGLAFLTYVQVKRGKYLFAAKLTGALAGLRERLGIQANSTQLKAETESHDKMLGAMGEGAFQAALNTGREWDVTQTIRYLRSEEGV